MENLIFTTPQKRLATLLGTGLVLALTAGVPGPSAAGEDVPFSLGAYGVRDAQPSGGDSPLFPASLNFSAEHVPGPSGGLTMMLIDVFDLPGRFGIVFDNSSGSPSFSGFALQPAEDVRIILDSEYDENGRSISGSLILRFDF